MGIDPQIEIERRLSAGGMGEVFLARQKHLGRYVAVKRIRDWGADAATKERFIHEAKALTCAVRPGRLSAGHAGAVGADPPGLPLSRARGRGPGGEGLPAGGEG